MDGEMPPEKKPQPGADKKAAFIAWIEKNLRNNSTQSKKITHLRRLTNREYHNTLRDLLGIDLNFTDTLSKDPQTPYKFNNNSDTMMLGSDQLQEYHNIASRALQSVIVSGEKPKTHTSKNMFRGSEHAPPHLGKNILQGNQIETAVGYRGPGPFRVRFKAGAILPDGYSEFPFRLIMGHRLRSDFGTGDFAVIGNGLAKNNIDNMKIYEYFGHMENYPAEKGKHGFKVTLSIQDMFNPGNLSKLKFMSKYSKPRLEFEWIEIDYPYYESWPPAYHKAILFESPLRKSNEKGYVKAILEKFLQRAFRRPAKQEELSRFRQMFEILRKGEPDFVQAVRDTLTMVLISPQFLQHTEFDNGKQNITDYELASRLSYFLWETMPDQQLFDLAEKKKLNNPQILNQQIKRMIAHPNSRQFISNFTHQWLSIEKIRGIAVNRNLFPHFLDLITLGERSGQEVSFVPTIRDMMIDETVSFVEEVIKKNLSVSNFIDSDFAMLNSTLASHYGIPGVNHSEIKRVKLKPEYKRGGLLTHGSVLVANSNGSAPHPIYRAVWLREAILGDEVAAPPSEVPSLTDSVKDVKEASSIKRMLEIHRTKESCNDCHVRLDPWGIPFEEYNAAGVFQPKVPKKGSKVRRVPINRYTGEGEIKKIFTNYEAYRKKINTVPVVKNAKVPRGPEINGVAELKAYLLKHKLEIHTRAMIEKLMTYALGRPLVFKDRDTVEMILRRTKKNGYPLQDIISEIILSKQFREQ